MPASVFNDVTNYAIGHFKVMQAYRLWLPCTVADARTKSRDGRGYRNRLNEKFLVNALENK